MQASCYAICRAHEETPGRFQVCSHRLGGPAKTWFGGARQYLAAAVAIVLCGPALSGSCAVQSGAQVRPVIELYTSQGCSSCPPADRWLSSLSLERTPGEPVIQAFHVAYWDYIGWVDRFAAPAHTQRQRQLAVWNGLRSIYTPQVLVNGRDWRQWRGGGQSIAHQNTAARVRIEMRQQDTNTFEATVTTLANAPSVWGAYWTVTEDAHQTSVGAGENAGEQLRNDHVVRQYVPVGQHQARLDKVQTLVLHAVASASGHTRKVNLVLFDPRDGQTLQALALRC